MGNKNIISKGLRYWRERKKWAEAGQPIRSDDKINQLFEICVSCPNYIDRKVGGNSGICDICGCYVSKSDFTKNENKLRWATTNCPDDPPRWNAELEENWVLPKSNIQEPVVENNEELAQSIQAPPRRKCCGG